MKKNPAQLQAWCMQPVLLVQVRAGSIFPCHLSGTVCESQSNRTSHRTVCHNMSEICICWSCYSSLHPGSFDQSWKNGGRVQKLYVKRVLFTEEKGKEHLQITRGVASSILHIFAVALWKPQRLSIASPLAPNVKLSAHTEANVNYFSNIRECLF